MMFWVLALSLASSFATADTVTPQPLDLSAMWLTTENTIPVAKLEVLTKLMEQDPETKALLAEFMSFTGSRNSADILKIVHLCNEDPNSDVKYGAQSGLKDASAEIFPATIEDLLSGKEPEEYFKDEVEAKRVADKALVTATTVTRDYVRVRTAFNPSICVSNDMNIAEAFEMLVHEMTHIVKETWKGDDMLSYASDQDYFEKQVQQPGEEVEAYIAGLRARIRLEKNRNFMREPLRSMFDNAGNFVGNRELFGLYILAADDPRTNNIKEGYGYNDDRFGTKYYQNNVTGEVFGQNEYTLRFNAARRIEISNRASIANWLANAKENVAIFEKAVPILASNIRIYKDRIADAQRAQRQVKGATARAIRLRKQFAADEATARADLADENAKLEKAQKSLSAFKGRFERLSADLVQRDERLKKYDELADRYAKSVKSQ